MSNMELWEKVCETDPKHTKPVTFGRTFTAIDPMYQIMNATKAMGVAGGGWGFSVVETLFLPTDQVAIRVKMWYKMPNNSIEQWGQNGLYIDAKKSKPDGDCMKKATTDGITKCLTYFGFNADVFMGKFDDNKYVQAMEDKHRVVDWTRKYEQIKKKLEDAKDVKDLGDAWKGDSGQLKHMKGEDNKKYLELEKIKNSRKKKLEDTPIDEKTDDEKLTSGEY